MEYPCAFGFQLKIWRGVTAIIMIHLFFNTGMLDNPYWYEVIGPDKIQSIIQQS